MLKKHLLAASIALISTTLYAIPIESRNLSGSNSASNPQTANTSNANEPAVATNLNWQLMQKNQQLENDIRALRGQLEEHENEIDKLNSELNNRYTDLDQRLELLLQKIEPAEPEENAEGTGAIDANATPEQEGTAASPATTTTQPTELEKAAYTVALDAYKQGGAKKAIPPMENFIKSNPNSVYTPNAHFWLAEFYLASDQINYNEAKKHYTLVAQQYPKSAKAARSLYQLYNIAANVDKDSAQAERYKTQIIQNYAGSEEASFFK